MLFIDGGGVSASNADIGTLVLQLEDSGECCTACTLMGCSMARMASRSRVSAPFGCLWGSGIVVGIGRSEGG